MTPRRRPVDLHSMRLLVLAFVLSVWVSPAAARVIHVLPDGSGDAPTIAAAFAIAVFGDTISLGDGTFYEHDLVPKSGVHIRSDSGDPALTAIDAAFSGRCLNGASVTGAPTFVGITLRNGVHATEAGLFLGGHNNMIFRDCVFRDGAAPRGGAVSLTGTSGHSPQFTRCRFESNEATSDGGAVWSRGVGIFSACEFIANTAGGHGGAAYGTKLDSFFGDRFSSCRFEGNVANGDGGAIYSTGQTFYLGTNIVNCEFVSNSATNGGAARLEDYDFAYNSGFLRNEATIAGGALFLVRILVDKEFDLYARNLMAGNIAGARGGAIAMTSPSSCQSCLLTLHNSTLSGNSAPTGAHIWSNMSNRWGDLRHTILAFAPTGAAVAGIGTLDATCLDVYGNAGGDYVGQLSGKGGVNGNISADPLFCDPGADDYTLREGSPCYTPLPPGCGTGSIGKYGIGCSVPTSTEAASWGRIKAIFK